MPTKQSRFTCEICKSRVVVSKVNQVVKWVSPTFRYWIRVCPKCYSSVSSSQASCYTTNYSHQ